MIKNETDFRRVLIHELGHFISHQILFENIGEYPPHKIEVKWDSKHNHYIGEHTHKNKLIGDSYIDINESKIQEFPNILNMLYGCIFQAIYRNDIEEFSLCKNCIHGSNDYYNVTRVYGDYRHCHKKHSAEIIIHNHLNTILELNISDLLINLDLDYFIDNQSNPNHFIYNVQYLNENETINSIKSKLKQYFTETYDSLSNIQN